MRRRDEEEVRDAVGDAVSAVQAQAFEGGADMGAAVTAIDAFVGMLDYIGLTIVFKSDAERKKVACLPLGPRPPAPPLTDDGVPF